jgi:hypothetical protein
MSRSVRNRRNSPLRSIMLAAATLALTTRCTEGNEPREGVGGNVEQCLPYEEVRHRCNEAFNECLNSPIQSIRSGTSGHSLCHACQDVCMQKNGTWPDRLRDGRPCR